MHGSEMGATVAGAPPAILRTPIVLPGETRNPFLGAFLSLPELYSAQQTEHWLLEGLFTRGEMGMIYGESGCGKTFVTIDLLFALALSPAWCGERFGIPRACTNVVYCTGEGQARLWQRFAAAEERWRDACDVAETPLNLRVVKQTPQLFDAGSEWNVSHYVDAYLAAGLPPLDVMVIDTLHRATAGANENSNGDAGTVIAALDHIRTRLGCAVLLVHHSGKALGSRERGAGAYRGAMDFMLEVRAVTPHLSGRLCCDKLKDGDPFPDQHFTFQRCRESLVLAWHGDAAAQETRFPTRRERIEELLLERPGTRYTVKEGACIKCEKTERSLRRDG